MLTASFFSLLQPAIEYAEVRAAHNGLGVLASLPVFFAGAGLLFSIQRYSPHEHVEVGRVGYGDLWAEFSALRPYGSPNLLSRSEPPYLVLLIGRALCSRFRRLR